MRQIFLDTETTGLDPAQGHRIIEVAAVEVINRRLTGNHYHVYINPERDIDAGAQAVHGITLERLQNEPKFAEIAHEFLDFIGDAELIIHNAPFDLGFLNHELGMLELGKIGNAIIDTLKMAREMHPGQRNNLDALCKRYGIDNSNRTLHGALLDAELLADVYMAMTRGQDSLIMEISLEQAVVEETVFVRQSPLKVIAASAEEAEAHQQYLASLDKAAGGTAVWRQFEASNNE
ncbi:DNA polymerase III subunit epsilon [Novimethylophilus kurashikiensis]|uniref:DNA polymerase III subunit epsilon n=1 Tax=Novimethylophilus kurashikiensis TaxID=1825523 RepID=A0A2R5F325_9PROT|nr:DNA polymerase III subunit epsilon [Novimethylophilus kurashikiensis]GBG12947.1 DNA polymerase III subunit epsilon [Novimethylophilus kurashikiensis]